MTYNEKKTIADNYLASVTENSIGWDDLPDINSLHDAETEEEIKALCDARLSEDEFFDFMDE